ncbi:hypothetical protein HOD29_07005 [archaeon]|jgi:hypothetical protein|nr:hypothetical protein [archaeon]
MLEMLKILIGIGVLVLGYFIGNVLRHKTKDEMKDGRIWFKIIVYLSLVGGIVGLIIGDDVLMFSLFFIAIVSSRSLVLKK